jgi:1,4-dihydroxy-2-naphthoate octaprenyltransferase
VQHVVVVAREVIFLHGAALQTLKLRFKYVIVFVFVLVFIGVGVGLFYGLGPGFRLGFFSLGPRP